jgi:hypothetical protein
MTHPRALRPLRSNAAGYHALTCIWFWAWAAVGATAALGLVSLGPLALIPSSIAAAALMRNESRRRSAPGILAGAGLLSLYVAYVQRAGPGTSCWHTATAAGCDQHLNPIPWLVIGLALIVGAVLAQNHRDS